MRLLALLLLCAGWAGLAGAGSLAGAEPIAGAGSTTPRLAVPEGARAWTLQRVDGALSVSGDWLVTAPLVVEKTGALRLEAGTRLFFDVAAPAQGAPAPWISVEGSFVAAGTQAAPVTLTSLALVEDARQDILSVANARELRLEHAHFSRAGWGLHLHETPGAVVSECSFTDLHGGARFKCDGLALRGNLFAHNRIGVRCIDSVGPVFEGNAFAGNLTGIFFRQEVRDARVEGNDFDNLEYDVKLGAAQTFDVAAPRNYWKTKRIYDAGAEPGLGAVATDPPLSAPVTRKLP